MADLTWPTKKTQIRDKKFAIAGVYQNLLVDDNIRSGFFKLMLLTRCSEEGILYSPRTNYRLATKEKLTVKNNLTKSMLEYAMSSGNSDEFSTKIALTFYQIDQAETDNAPPTLTSISRETVSLDDKPYESTEVLIEQTVGKHVSQFEYQKLCYILNTKPQQLTKDSKDQGLFDFTAILGDNANATMLSNQSLSEYVRVVLNWTCFAVKENLTLPQNIRRVRSFLQTLTGVGISVIEGAHRVTLATKLMTGMNLDQSLPFIPAKHSKDNVIPSDSPIWGTANVQVLVKKRDEDEATNQRQIILSKTLKTYRSYSQRIAENKTHYIESTWKDWIGQVLQEIRADSRFDQDFDEKSFSKLAENSKRLQDDAYIQNYQLVTKQVANGLFNLLPAKRLAQIAKTMPEKARQSETVNLETFIENLCQDNTKWAKYTHQFWAGVS